MARNPASGPRRSRQRAHNNPGAPRKRRPTFFAVDPEATGFGSMKIISRSEFEERKRQGMPVSRIG